MLKGVPSLPAWIHVTRQRGLLHTGRVVHDVALAVVEQIVPRIMPPIPMHKLQLQAVGGPVGRAFLRLIPAQGRCESRTSPGKRKRVPCSDGHGMERR